MDVLGSMAQARTTRWPLHIYKTGLRLERPSGTYAVLAFERGPANPAGDIRCFAALTKELLSSSRLSFTFEQPEEPEVAEGVEGEEAGKVPF